MSNQQTVSLTRATFLFPLALVLFEFAVYIGNDLVQPAMLKVTEQFNVSSDLAPSSMSLYLLGGACFAWLLGPLSDYFGRKKVLLWGVLFFTICCLLILFSQNIEQFLLLRFLQGIGLSFIGAVGYAAIQETFSENDAIKVMALMANVSLLAPLLGPVLGAFLIEYVSWHWGFIAIAIISGLSWLGLKSKMPAHPPEVKQLSFSSLKDDFKAVLSNKQFLSLTLALPLLGMPLMLWIALSPIILIEELHLTATQYGLAQFPVLGGLILGNIVLIKVIDHFPLGRSALVGLPLMLVGTLIVLIGTAFNDYFLWCLILGMMLVSFGEGISFSVIYRFALTSSDSPKGTVAAAVSMLMMFTFFVMIEVVRLLYIEFGLWAYTLSCFTFIILWFTFPYKSLKHAMQLRKTA